MLNGFVTQKLSDSFWARFESPDGDFEIEFDSQKVATVFGVDVTEITEGTFLELSEDNLKIKVLPPLDFEKAKQHGQELFELFEVENV